MGKFTIEQRSQNHYETKPLPVTLYSTTSDIEYDGTLKNISCGGLMVECNEPLAGEFYINIRSEYWHKLTPTAVVRSTRDREGKNKADISLKFKTPLSMREIAPLFKNNKQRKENIHDSAAYDLASKDFNEVREGLRQIRSCRSNIFIGTIGAVSAGVFATGAILAQTIAPGTAMAIKNAVIWTTFGSLAILLLLGTGILATVEKGRAIAYREGFCAALSEYLIHGVAPSKYKGWSRLKNALFEWKIIRDLGYNIYTNKNDLRHEDESPWYRGKKIANEYLDQLKLFSKPFDSFMSFSIYTYSFTYLLIYLGFNISLANFLAIKSGLPESYVFYFWISWALSTAVAAATSDMIAHRNEGKSDVPSLIWLRRILWFGCLAGSVIYIAYNSTTNIEPLAAYIVFACINLVFAYWGLYLLFQFYKLRKGKFCQIAMQMAWLILFEEYDPAYPRRDFDKLRNSPSNQD